MKLIDSYRELVHRCFTGREVSPRGLTTYEAATPATITFEAGETLDRKGYAPLLGLVEGLIMVAGQFNHAAIMAAAPGADPSYFTERGSYGPRITNSLNRAFAELVRDPSSRRAVAYIAGIYPDDTGHPDQPCTQYAQFFIRDGQVHSHFAMRSWDMAWGLPYDVVQFGLLTQVMARALYFAGAGGIRRGSETGTVTVTAGSAHIYQRTAHLPDETVGGPRFRLAPEYEHPNGAGLPATADLAAWRAWAREELAAIADGKKLSDIEWLAWRETQ